MFFHIVLLYSFQVKRKKEEEEEKIPMLFYSYSLTKKILHFFGRKLMKTEQLSFFRVLSFTFLSAAKLASEILLKLRSRRFICPVRFLPFLYGTAGKKQADRAVKDRTQIDRKIEAYHAFLLPQEHGEEPPEIIGMC